MRISISDPRPLALLSSPSLLPPLPPSWCFKMKINYILKCKFYCLFFFEKHADLKQIVPGCDIYGCLFVAKFND